MANYRVHDTQVDEFTWAYITALLWTTNEDDFPEYCYSGEFSISKEDADRFTGDALIQIISECSDFQEKYTDLLAQAGDDSQNGHDFALTRNGHGTGFWDRGYPKHIGDALSDACRQAGEVYVWKYASEGDDDFETCKIGID